MLPEYPNKPTKQTYYRATLAMISTGDQREVPQYIAQPWFTMYVNARTVSTTHTVAHLTQSHNINCTIIRIFTPSLIGLIL